MTRRQLLGAAVLAFGLALAGFARYGMAGPDPCAPAHAAFDQFGQRAVPATIPYPPPAGPVWQQVAANRKIDEVNRQAAAAAMNDAEVMMRVIDGDPSCFSPNQVARARTFLAHTDR